MKARILLAIFVALALWMKTGAVVTSRMEGEDRIEFFWKTDPTLQVLFNDPYRSDVRGEELEYRKRMDASGDWLLGTQESSDYLAYCRYRYGISDVEETEATSKCRGRDRH